MKNNHKIIVKCRWWSGWAVSSAVVHGGALAVVHSDGKLLKNYEQLKIEET